MKENKQSFEEACKNFDDAWDKLKRELLIIIYPKISPVLNFLSKPLEKW